MSDPSDHENEPRLQPRHPYARPGPIPNIRLEGFLQERAPSLIPRDSSSSTKSGSSSTFTSCGPKDTTGPCERNTSSTDNTTLPIVLGVLIPLGVAFIAMLILHRRHLKKLRKEDAEDKHKSLDFGLAEGGPLNKPKKTKKGSKVPEMSMAETRNAVRGDRGLSMDMGVPNPYLPPPGLQQSRESLHSMSRSFNQGDDRYGRTTFIPDDGSIRTPSRARRSPDDSSSYTGSSRPNYDAQSSKTLIKSESARPRENGAAAKETSPPPTTTRKPPPPNKDGGLLVPSAPDGRESFLSTTSSNGPAVAAFRKSNDYLSAFIRGGFGGDLQDSMKQSHTKVTESKPGPEPPKEEFRPPPPVITKTSEPVRPERPERSDNLAKFETQQLRPTSRNVVAEREPRLPQLSLIDSQGDSNKEFLNPEISVSETLVGSEPSTSHSSMQKQARGDSQQYSSHTSLQSPSHDSQQYQQRDSRQHQQHDSQQYQQRDSRQYQQHDSQQYQDYHDPYGRQQDQYHHQQIPKIHAQQYDNEDDYYDPEDTYSVYDDYQEELGYDVRRSTMGMRPLPPDDPSENPEQRANRIRSFYKEYFDESGRNPNAAYDMGYYDGPEYHDEYYGQDGYYPPRGHSSTGGRHRATVSNGSHMPGPRAFSSASARYGYPAHARPRPRGPPKKRAPPPKALQVIPAPSKLKDDTFLIDQSIDFAPPLRAVMQRSGTPESGRGGQRAYSPTVRAHIPLASSFDDLTMMPSPHQLRNSGVFTSLDFAPPRFRTNQEAFSDSGSIRSARSGTSMSTHNAIRKGAYRVSRIPKDVVGTQTEIGNALKPNWDMSR